MSDIKTYSLALGGRTLEFSVGKFARQANSAVTVRYGDTVVLATAVIVPTPRDETDYFPLMVDYEERLYAAGIIKGSRFIKRETRPTDEAVLSARMVDRSIRPLFPESLRNDVQVILTILSVDGENDPDIAALYAASAALAISEIPWNGPIAGLRIGQIEGEWVINPTYAARLKSVLDVVIATNRDKIIMVETAGQQIPEETIVEAFRFGQKHAKDVGELIERMQQEIGKPKMAIVHAKAEFADDPGYLKAKEEAQRYTHDELHKRFFTNNAARKGERKSVIAAIEAEIELKFIEQSIVKEQRKAIVGEVAVWVEEEVTRAIIEDGKRVDGRALDEIRSLTSEVALLPRTHGSGLFERGETQVLSVVTLGAPGDEQLLEGIEGNEKKRYMHHYNFPPYSVGEARPIRSTSRREIGHGALAEKALVPVLPLKEAFPYTIRVVSEVLGSNGSSSMGSTCGSSLALMDAGVPIKAAVAGIAMGLASDAKGRYKIFTDLQDLEDGPGGMDFKVAGTRTGVTAIQMDTKSAGISLEQAKETLEKARAARMKILDTMDTAIREPRPELSQYAPKIVSFTIKPDQIRTVIGPGGKMINEIIDKTGVDIDIEDSGLVCVTGVNVENLNKAVEWIKNLTREVVAGEIYEGKVTRILDFGAFVEILPKQEGMVHVSELAHYRVGKVTDIVNIGDIVKVKVIAIDDLNRINLSIKALTPPPEHGAEGYGGGNGGGGFGRPQKHHRSF